jgi:type I restriction enzyme S subunit
MLAGKAEQRSTVLSFHRYSISQSPLPPVAEQHRIVAKIEELFSELDAGEENLRTARRKLGVYRQSLLKQAFEGGLTEAWRKQNRQPVESPDQLLKCIQDERQSQYEERIKDWKKSIKAWESGKLKGKKPIKPREAEVVPLTEDGISDLPGIPSPWIWTSLSELSGHIVDGTHKTPKYVAQGVQFISAKDVNDFTISFANTKYITAEEHEELWRRCRPSEGDILLTKSGTIGRVAVVRADHEFSVFESVAVIPISRSVEPQFFAFQIYCTVQGSFGAAN